MALSGSDVEAAAETVDVDLQLRGVLLSRLARPVLEMACVILVQLLLVIARNTARRGTVNHCPAVVTAKI